MAQHEVIIIGAGLSGLLTAKLAKEAGCKVIILEARDRIGGRIQTIKGPGEAPVEMGATWFHPQHLAVKRLLEELQMQSFEQKMRGITFYEAGPQAGAQAMQLPPQPPSYRIAGGTSSLLERIARFIEPQEIHFNCTVSSITFDKSRVSVKTSTGTFEGDQVIGCLPPHLIKQTIQFEPPLPQQLAAVMNQTHTWMRDSTKIALTFEKPFWRAHNFSGVVFSNLGPVQEFYDHSNYEDDHFALCGFLHPQFQDLSKEARKAKILQQLQACLGPEVLNFTAYHEMHWSTEPLTTEQKPNQLVPHQNNGHSIYRNTFYDGRLILAGSETAVSYPGYMDGAITAAKEAFQKIKTQAKLQLEDNY